MTGGLQRRFHTRALAYDSTHMDMLSFARRTARTARPRVIDRRAAVRTLLAPLLLVLTLTACAAAPSGFDSAAWKAQRGVPYEKNSRNAMVVAARDRLHVGMTRDEVVALLGEPDSRKQDGAVEVYAVGTSGLAIDAQFLELTYRDGRLVSSAITEA